MKTENTKNRILSRKPSICFVALGSYNLIAKRDDINHIGGAEVQQGLISKWLLKRGFSVSFITYDHGQPNVITHDGIRVYKAYKVEKGLPVVRFFHPRWTGLWRALEKVDADVYYQRGASSETGQVALWCRLRRKPFVFATASESDCMKTLPLLQVHREKILYRMGLGLVDFVVAQTKRQQELLKEHFKVSSYVIKNCGELPVNTFIHKQDAKSILWVGRISPVKRFEWFLEVAGTCPELQFEVVGASNVESNYSASLEKRANALPNVKMHGPVSHTKMSEFYSRCKILCSTSSQEGFPNTFLEAWRGGIPTISTFDPDGTIEAEGLGWIVHSVSDMASKIRKVVSSEKIWQKASSSAKKYFLENHATDITLPKLEELLLKNAGYLQNF